MNARLQEDLDDAIRALWDALFARDTAYARDAVIPELFALIMVRSCAWSTAEPALAALVAERVRSALATLAALDVHRSGDVRAAELELEALLQSATALAP